VVFKLRFVLEKIPVTPSSPYSKETLYAAGKTRRFSGDDAIQVAMPLGGIGAGCVCLNAQGGLQDFSIRNAPATSALPDGHAPSDAAFATLYFPELGLARLVEGPLPAGRIYDQGLKGQGARSGGHEGLPRFRHAEFQGEYPFGRVELTDSAAPGEGHSPGETAAPLAVTITGFNPLIPLDDKNSSLPCAILEYTFRNPGEQAVPFEFGYHISHFAMGADGGYAKTRNGVVEEGLGNSQSVSSEQSIRETGAAFRFPLPFREGGPRRLGPLHDSGAAQEQDDAERRGGGSHGDRGNQGAALRFPLPFREGGPRGLGPLHGTRGLYLYNEEDPNTAAFGSCALGVIGFEPLVKAMWFRGGWFDSTTVLWKEVSTGTFTENDGSKAAGSEGRNGGSLLVKHTLAPGETVTIPVVVAWYFPNVHYAHGEAGHGEAQAEACGADSACHAEKSAPRWKPYYTTLWSDARDVLLYVQRNYASLRARTQAFHDALFSSTLPAYVLDAVSANLAILKSPTVLRQANGNMWAWEGCFPTCGCCHGSCTHVWNYAQAIPHLFPQLERTLREQELERSLDSAPDSPRRGHVTFRSALPDGPTPHTFHAASDGQLGGIMKAYREYTICGDLDWLARLFPALKLSLDYCIAAWDPDRLGVLVEPHHNTYDIEFWGADGMCSSFYLGALAAMEAIINALKERAGADWQAQAAAYRELGQRGAKYMDEHLFNGEYYQQKVQLMGLRASPTEQDLAALREANPEEHALRVSEGPKYQYGAGCISDGVFGAWLARLCGVESYQNREHIRANLKSIFAHNFRPSLWEHANTQRPGYALGDEPGLLLCTWPRGGKPTLPFVYSDEVWTGIEYQVASHLIAEGLVDEGLTIVKALRSRFDGKTRNPWNEYECGSYYARAMASYALLIALSGFRYDAPTKTLYISPKLEARPFTCFFSTASGWGTVTVGEETVEVKVVEGSLEVKEVVIL